ncbi:ferric reductase-like transmembrane domain-containing protein [Paenibacillus sp. CAA11]|uniref:ferric reductase-like transmembrane domain-containing protein n=1 Tax=Paenibacillus sp. CAA11 TaxID=1532905 RepID=UPI00131EDE59|nr:ferric reductase-like transmembrane domain-containing protein [Paenibacillus sp. CAA11]
MITWFENLGDYLNVWNTVRAAGITSYLLLFVSMIAGMMQGTPLVQGKRKGTINLIHQASGWFGLLFGMVHGMVLYFDQHVGYQPLEILVPFMSHSHPILNGLGTLVIYLMALLIISSDLMKCIGRKVWRSIHVLAFPAFVMALVHGLLLGSDSSDKGIRLMYAVTGGATAAMFIWRIYVQKKLTARKMSAQG